MSTVYGKTILGESGLVSYWRLGEAAGTEAVDSKGANKGEYKATPTLGVAGPIGADPNSAITLNGTSQYITVAHAASLNYGDVFSYELWLKRSGTAKAASIITKNSKTAKLGFTAEDKLLLRKHGVSNICESTSKITDAAWHHIVATKNGTTSKLYIDSIDVTGTVTNATMESNELAFFIGAEGGPEEFLNASIDEVALYNVALSAAQVLDHYQKGVSGGFRRSLLGVGR